MVCFRDTCFVLTTLATSPILNLKSKDLEAHLPKWIQGINFDLRSARSIRVEAHGVT